MEEQIRARTVRLLDAIPRGETVDFVDVFSAPLPVLVIADLLGVSEADRVDFRRWSDAAITASDGRDDLNAEDLHERDRVGRRSSTLTPAPRPRTPGDDLVSLLVEAEVEGRPLRPGELVTFAMSLLVAGNETTRHLLSGGLVELAEHPDQRASLVDDPSRMPAAVEECLRWTTPIQQFARTATARYRTRRRARGRGRLPGDAVRLGQSRRDRVRADGRRVRRPPRGAGREPGLRLRRAPVPGRGAGPTRGADRVRGAAGTRFPDYEVVGPVEWLASSLVRGPNVCRWSCERRVGGQAQIGMRTGDDRLKVPDASVSLVVA